MSLVVSGAFSETIPKQSAVACGTTLSSDAGIDVVFLTTEGEAVASVDLAIDDVMKDETGSGFPATLRVRHTDQRSWTVSDCAAEVLAHAYQEADEMFDYHRISGTLACGSPAESNSGMDAELAIESFAFVCTVPWTR